MAKETTFWRAPDADLLEALACWNRCSVAALTLPEEMV
jgi:hypothetical protein